VGVIPVGNGSRSGSGKTRGEYIKLTDKEKAIVGEYAAKHGIAVAVGQGRKRDAPLVQIEVQPSKRRGRPLLLGKKWEDEVVVSETSTRQRLCGQYGSCNGHSYQCCY